MGGRDGPLHSYKRGALHVHPSPAMLLLLEDAATAGWALAWKIMPALLHGHACVVVCSFSRIAAALLSAFWLLHLQGATSPSGLGPHARLEFQFGILDPLLHRALIAPCFATLWPQFYFH